MDASLNVEFPRGVRGIRRPRDAKSGVESGMGALQLDLLQGRWEGPPHRPPPEGMQPAKRAFSPTLDSFLDVWYEAFRVRR